MGTTPEQESASLRSGRRELSAIELRSFVWAGGRTTGNASACKRIAKRMAIWNLEGAKFKMIGEDFAFHIDLSSSHACVQQP
jgi:hypothetical protein